jgi:hypothetical protein
MQGEITMIKNILFDCAGVLTHMNFRGMMLELSGSEEIADLFVTHLWQPGSNNPSAFPWYYPFSSVCPVQTGSLLSASQSAVDTACQRRIRYWVPLTSTRTARAWLSVMRQA